MNEIISFAGPSLVQASLQAALLALIVAAICRWMPVRIPPHVQFLLWGVVFVRLALPVLPASPFSGQRLLDTVATSKSGGTARPADERLHMPPTVAAGSPAANDSPPSVSPPIVFQTVEPRVSELETIQRTSNFAASWPVLPVVVWLAGVVTLGIRQFLQERKLIRSARNWEIANDAILLQRMDSVRHQMRVRRPVQLLLADAHVGPAMFGLLRPRIVLPEATLSSIPDKHLEMLLLHEVSHIRRCDVLWERLARIIVALHWFNPAAWWALTRLRETREQACDASVLRCLGSGQAAEYGKLVLALAGGSSSPEVLVAAHGSLRSLQRRIEMISTCGTTNWRQTALGIVALLAVVLCGLTRAPAPDNANPAASGVTFGDLSPAAEDYEISGTCTDENEKPLAGVRVRVFRMEDRQNSPEQMGETVTGDDGTFSFTELPQPEVIPGLSRTAEYYKTYYTVVAQAPGRATRGTSIGSSRDSPQNLDFRMMVAETLSGRVTDDAGQPVEGATVYIHSFLLSSTIDGVMMDVTDANGRYEITDLVKSGDEKPAPKPVGNEGLAAIPNRYVLVLHPQYGKARETYTTIPSEVHITVHPAATIEGLVIDQVTGKPFAGARVFIQGVDDMHHYSASVESDADGHYRLTSLAAGSYNVICKTPDRTSVAIDSLQVEAGQVCERNIPLIEGCWIEGRVVDIASGEPLAFSANGTALQVAVYGPSHPKSGAAVEGAWVGPDGRFGLRVAPGRNFPYIMTSEVWQRTEDQEKYREGIDVGDGELVSLEFRVLPEPPRKKPEFSPVRLPIPVAEERAAAAAVRRLGGWYAVDDARHVVELNMVYHKTKEDVRYENMQAGTDEILQWVPRFPHLQRLYLKQGQATDGNMHFVNQCPRLEEFYVWDAHAISDAGIEHLRPLKHLKRIHVSNSQITDRSMEVFGTLPALERLSLQGNRFTDEGISHIAGLTSLASLAIYSEHSHFTNDIVRHLVKLTNLELLDLQGVPLTDAGIRELSALMNLKSICIGGAPPENAEAITDASVKVLAGFKQTEYLLIQRSRLTDAGAMELAALPTLKEMTLYSTSFSDEGKKAVKTRYPEKRISLYEAVPGS